MTEAMLTKEEEDIASGKPIAKARPRHKPTETLTSVSILVIERKWIDIETKRSHDHRCYEVSNTITRLLRHDQSVPRGSDGAIPNSSNQFLYFRAKQGHSGKSGIDPALQDNVLLPKGFTEYIYHVGNANELNSMLRNGLIPRGKSLKRGRPAVFFTTVNPMEDICGMGENPCDLTPRIAPYKNTWKHLQNTVFWCNLKLAQEKDVQFYQTGSHAVVLYNTLPAACIETAVCMKTQDELYQKVPITPRVPRVVLKSNSQYGLARSTKPRRKIILETSNDLKSDGEICNNTVDHRISGVPLSAVEQQNRTRENKVKRLIEKFENHTH